MENKKLNLYEILRNCPNETKLYSPICGVCFLNNMSSDNIEVTVKGLDNKNHYVTFCTDGRFRDCCDGEIMLFPSKDNRDWSTFKPKKEHFDPNTLKPFDKILVRDTFVSCWMNNFFGFTTIEGEYRCVSGGAWKYCIPYNDDTKHLVGTTNEAPEYYRYWED